MKDRIS